MKSMRALALGGLLLTTAVAAQAAGNVAAGQAKSGVCAGCHGPDGNSPTPMFPKLAGQVPEYIAKQLGDFKAGKRQNPIMSGMAAPLSPADMQNLAAYFSSQTTKPGVAEGDKETIALGRKIYHGGNIDTGLPACMSCHGPGGHGVPPRFPRVSGQYAAYTEAQLLAFKNGTRTNDDNTMTRIAAQMSPAEIKAVSQYIAGLK
jgi:cytochrome c553